MKQKVTYILSNIDKAIAFEWISKKIDKSKIELSFILLNNTEPYLLKWLEQNSIEHYFIDHHGKKSFPKSIIKVRSLLKKIKPNIVHTHLFDANLIGLFCAKSLGIKKRIYTRHHSTFHHKNFPSAIKYDRLSNYMSTKIIAISKNVRNVLIDLEKVPLNKTELIHHGFDLQAFEKVNKNTIAELKSKYNLVNTKGPVIGIVARFIKWKGIQYTLEAFRKILIQHPDAVLILANANGPDKTYIHSLLKGFSSNNIRIIPFEANLFALYHLFDLYIHVPIDKEIEAFGQTYVEALAAGIPSIFTISGVANEYIIHNHNALVVDYNNSIEIEQSIYTLLNNKELQNKLTQQGKKDVHQFNLDSFVKKLENLYLN